MQKLEIGRIESGLPMDGAYFQVGENGVTKIEDKSLEYESEVEFIYIIYNGPNRIAEWVNVPVKITYIVPTESA